MKKIFAGELRILVFLMCAVMLYAAWYIHQSNAASFVYKADTEENFYYDVTDSTYVGEIVYPEYTMRELGLRFDTGEGMTDKDFVRIRLEGDSIQQTWRVEGTSIEKDQILWLPLQGYDVGKGKLKLEISGEGSTYKAIAIGNEMTEEGETLETIAYQALVSETPKSLIYIGVFLAVLFVFFIFIVVSEKGTYVRLFLVLWVVLGSVYLAVLPIMSEPDSKNHYCRAYEISQGQFISQRDQWGEASGYFSIPEDWAGINSDNIRISAYEVYHNSGFLVEEKTENKYHYNNIALYSPFSYLPQAAGILFGRQLTNQMVVIVYMGRIFNYLAIGGVYCLTIALMPFARKYILWIALMPMNLHQAVSLAPDGMVTALICLLLAAVCYLRCQKNARVTGGMIALLYLTAFFLSQYKIVYVVVCMALFCIPKEKFKSIKIYYVHVILLGIVILSASLWWLNISSRFLAEQYVTSGDQVAYILKNPIHYIGIMWNTLWMQAKLYVEQIMGIYMGPLLIKNDETLLYLVYGAFLIKSVRDYNAAGDLADKKMKFNFAAFMLLTVVLIATCEYVQWTEYQSLLINGIQGRYFIPLILPALLIVGGMRQDDRKKERIQYALLIGLDLCVALNVGMSYLYLIGDSVLY
ncbi:MAG: DUF2142 domain-containing protein [Eubacteriales bacterium]|nr:DUF2142 domain-containing protein [Eubacteriales bacterium]